MDDDFDGDDDGDFTDDDSLEDSFEDNCEAEDSFEVNPEMDDEPDEAESQEDGFTAREAFFFGSAMGWAYEEGLEEAERRKLEKEMEDDNKVLRNKGSKT